MLQEPSLQKRDFSEAELKGKLVYLFHFLSLIYSRANLLKYLFTPLLVEWNLCIVTQCTRSSEEQTTGESHEIPVRRAVCRSRRDVNPGPPKYEA